MQPVFMLPDAPYPASPPQHVVVGLSVVVWRSIMVRTLQDKPVISDGLNARQRLEQRVGYLVGQSDQAVLRHGKTSRRSSAKSSR